MDVCVQAINQSADFMQCRKVKLVVMICFVLLGRSRKSASPNKQSADALTFMLALLLLLHPLFVFIFFGQLPIGRRKFCSLKHHSTSSWPITVTNLLRKLLPM
jgi:hypothetical protein